MSIPLEEDLSIGEQPRGPEERADDVALLRALADEMRRAQDYRIGFPVNLDFDYRDLAQYLAVHGNNVGSPCASTDYHLHSKYFERAVVEFFAQLAGAPAGEAFGYMTNGGTESNLFGAYPGRERHPDAVLYASARAHYSVPKIARILRMEYVGVPTDETGAMDLSAFRSACHQHRTKAAVVVATIGSTGEGAVEDLRGIHRVLTEVGIDRAHSHADGAFGGLLAALGPRPVPWGGRRRRRLHRHKRAQDDRFADSLRYRPGPPRRCGEHPGARRGSGSGGRHHQRLTGRLVPDPAVAGTTQVRTPGPS